MPDFVKADAPLAPPTQCVYCHTHKDIRGFAHREVDIPGYGRVYVCAQCARDLGRLFDMIAPEVHAAALEQVSEARARIDELEKELDEEKLNKVIPLADVIDFFKEHEDRRGYKPGEKPATTQGAA